MKVLLSAQSTAVLEDVMESLQNVCYIVSVLSIERLTNVGTP